MKKALKTITAIIFLTVSMGSQATHVNKIIHGSTTSANEIFGAGVFLGMTIGSAVLDSMEWSKANPQLVAKQNKLATYNCGSGYNTEMDQYNAELSGCSYVGPVLKF